ncbi:MAG TPA: ABC transporter permease [Acidimicrobiales bacterium]|nr:ABC transporter permease [Acidimicrobiales bacterium]
MRQLRRAVGDGMIVAQRNVIKIRRVPTVLVGALIQPLTMIVVFGFVFGGAIEIPNGNYREFLIGGVFATTVTFSSSFTAAGLADDMRKGIIDRFRSLPMSRSAVVVGRTASDLVLTMISVLVMGLAGLAVGWRVPNGIRAALAGFALLLLYAYALSWIMAYVGLRVRSVETVNNAALIVIFPLTFAANTMVPADTLPDWLRPVAEWNPVSAITQAAREIFGNIPAGTPEPTAWSLQNPVTYTLICVAVILFVFVPLSIRRYGT